MNDHPDVIPIYRTDVAPPPAPRPNGPVHPLADRWGWENVQPDCRRAAETREVAA